MADDDKNSTLKRERSEEETEQAEDERPTKVAKTVDDDGADEAEEAEEKKAAAKGDCGDDGCGTDSSPTEDGEGPSAGGTNEEAPNEPNATNATETPTAGVEEAKATDLPEKAKDASPSSKTAETVSTEVSGLPPGVSSGVPGVPNTAVDPNQLATVTNPEQVLEERAEIEKSLVGRVIGKGGEAIRDLNARSGCRVDVDQNVPEDAPRIITYRGTRQAIDFAKQLVATLCSEEGRDTELPLGLATRRQLIVPSSAIGKVIGRRGEMVRDLQTRSKCKIQVDHSNVGVTDPTTRQVIVTGTEDAVVKAEEMIMFLVANPGMDASTAIDMLVEDKARGGVWGSGPPYPNLPNEGRGMQGYGYVAPTAGGYEQQPGAYGGGYSYGATGPGEMEVFYAAKTFMGRIIGQRGVTINDLQKRSGCDIQINQDVPHGQDCEIAIKGSRQGIEMVKSMLREIIETGPNHPYAGGTGAPAPYQQGGYQAQPVSYPYQQVPAQPATYGAPYQYGAPAYHAPPGYGQPQMAPAYQAPQPYGIPAYQPQQQYAQPPMQAPPPPAAVWRAATTADGQTYYYNEKTGETQWEKPMGM